MEKSLLITTRKNKGLSQKDIAHRLHMDISAYNRREKGNTKISEEEWDKLAEILEVNKEDIFQENENKIIINNENNNGTYSGSNNTFLNIPEYLLETQKKYIEKLEEENKKLKEKLDLK